MLSMWPRCMGDGAIRGGAVEMIRIVSIITHLMVAGFSCVGLSDPCRLLWCVHEYGAFVFKGTQPFIALSMLIANTDTDLFKFVRMLKIEALVTGSATYTQQSRYHRKAVGLPIVWSWKLITQRCFLTHSAGVEMYEQV